MIWLISCGNQYRIRWIVQVQAAQQDVNRIKVELINIMYLDPREHFNKMCADRWTFARTHFA
jgi:hypothetical protein